MGQREDVQMAGLKDEHAEASAAKRSSESSAVGWLRARHSVVPPHVPFSVKHFMCAWLNPQRVRRDALRSCESSRHRFE
jgi:hypothetical protein